MRNIILLIAFTSTLAMAQFSGNTVKQIDEIQNNGATDITLKPDNKVKVDYFTVEKVLVSGANKELNESGLISVSELNSLDNITSNIQTQLDAKEATLPNTTDGDLLYYNSGQAALGIGTNGQLLRVSALGFPEWADVISVSVTTKGDIQTYSTAPDRLAVGADSQILSADSAEATGLKWIDLPVSSPITTEGDLSIGDNLGNPIRLPIGTAAQLLTSNGTTASWQDAPVSTTLTTKGDIQTFDTANAALPVGTDGSFLVADANETTGLKWSDTLSGTLNPVTDPINFTPTFGGSFSLGNGTVATAYYYRTGKFMSGVIDITVGTTTVVGNLIFGVPDGYVMDLPNGFPIYGSANFFDVGSNWYDGFIFPNSSTDLLVYPKREYTPSVGAQTLTSTAPFTWATGDKITLTFSNIPIVGWSSGTSAAVQNKELTAETANELSATIVGTTATLENYTWINTITKTGGTGKFDVNFAAGLFTITPSCIASVTNPSGTRQVSISTATTSVARVNITDSSGSPTDDNFTIHCSKQGADVNKSQVITGTFENINSTDLVKVVARRTGNQTITIAGQTPIDWNVEEEDNYNALSGTTFTSPRATSYSMCVNYLYDNNVGWSTDIIDTIYNLSVGGNFRREKTITGGAWNGDHLCASNIKMQAGETLTVDLVTTGASDRRLYEGSVYNYLTITENPDTESIIKNLNDNNNVECQTKFLSGVVSTAQQLSDYTFNNIAVGKKYEIIANNRYVHSNTTANEKSIVFEIRDGLLVIVDDNEQWQSNSKVNYRNVQSAKFVATTTQITGHIVSALNLTMWGDSTKQGSYIELCELPDNTILNSTKFN